MISRSHILDKKNIGLASLICSIAGWLVFAFRVALFDNISWDIREIAIPLYMMSWFLGVSLGGLFFFCKFEYKSRISLLFETMVVWLAISSIVAFVWLLLPSLAYYTDRPYYQSYPCRDNLTVISDSIKTYAEKHNGQLPPAEKWCDALIQETGISPEVFICPNSDTKIGSSDFMMNKAVSGLKLKEISPVVLLFEAKPSWNGVGGAESLYIGNHKDTGSNILSGENPWFVRTHETSQLKWK